MSQYHHIVNVEGIVKKGDYLLTVMRSEAEEHASGTLSFIGGKVEFTDRESEVVEKTLKREIMEEVGVEVANLRFITSTGFTSDNGASVVNLVFLCDWASGTPRAIDLEEVASVHWMTVDEIRTHEKTPPWILEYANIVEAFIIANM